MKQQPPVDEAFVHGAQASGVSASQPEIHEPAVHVHGIESVLQVVADDVHGVASLGGSP